VGSPQAQTGRFLQRKNSAIFVPDGFNHLTLWIPPPIILQSCWETAFHSRSSGAGLKASANEVRSLCVARHLRALDLKWLPASHVRDLPVLRQNLQVGQGGYQYLRVHVLRTTTFLAGQPSTSLLGRSSWVGSALSQSIPAWRLKTDCPFVRRRSVWPGDRHAHTPILCRHCEQQADSGYRL